MASIAEEIIDYGATLDFQLRERYEPQVTAAGDELELAFGKYTRPASKADWIPCGLNGCNEPHRYGFVIRLRDGRETHCGPDCGQKHFGAKWTEVVATVQATEEATATRNSVAKLLADRDALVNRGTDLAERSRQLEERVFSANHYLKPFTALGRAIDKCARSGGSIRAEIKSEATGIAAAGRPAKAELRTVATIEGIALLTPSFTRYSAVIDSMLPGLRALNAEALRGASKKDLAKRSKEGQTFTETLNRAERQLDSGDRLFEFTNLQKFELLLQHQLRSADITPQLRRALDDLYALVPAEGFFPQH